jgi:hypothetical protein
MGLMTTMSTFQIYSQKSKIQELLLLLFGRLVLFAGFQAVLTLVFWFAGRPAPVEDAAAWWLVQVILTNLTCIWLLSRLMHREGLSLGDLYRVEKHPFWKELFVALGIFLLGLPLGALPNTFVAQWLFGNTLTPALMMFRPIPIWGLVLGLLFPLTIAFAEIPYYFAYIMPRLQSATNLKWPVTIACGLVLAAQHITLPLIFDGRFILWRLLMYLPFAIFVGIVMQLRPRLLPYIMVFHALMDLTALSVYFTI